MHEMGNLIAYLSSTQFISAIFPFGLNFLSNIIHHRMNVFSFYILFNSCFSHILQWKSKLKHLVLFIPVFVMKYSIFMKSPQYCILGININPLYQFRISGRFADIDILNQSNELLWKFMNLIQNVIHSVTLINIWILLSSTCTISAEWNGAFLLIVATRFFIFKIEETNKKI